MCMQKEKIHEYKNGEITIVWTPAKFIHASKCVHTLPKVYKPGKKPWIRIENAASEELKSQIKTCPSGALSYRLNK